MAQAKQYAHSGKVKWSSTLLWLFIGAAISGVIGALYGFLAHINPFFYLNALLLIGLIFVLLFIITYVSSSSHCRNPVISVTQALLICLFAWYCNWCIVFSQIGLDSFFNCLLSPVTTINNIFDYANFVDYSVGKRSSSISIGSFSLIFLIIEFIAFIVPSYFFMTSKLYYCEKCEKTMSSVEVFIPNTQFVNDHIDDLKRGDLIFLQNTPEYTTKLPELKAYNETYKIDVCTCPICNNKVINLDLVKLSLSNKGNVETKDETSIIKDLHINDDSPITDYFS